MKRRVLILVILILFTLVAIASYKFINKGSNSSNFSGVSFNDLPKSVRAKYILRTDIPELSNYMGLPKEKIVETNAPIEGSNEELKAQIKFLREQNQALYQDNVNLNNKSWELAQEIQEEKRAISEEKRILREKNIQAIGEAEQQHYENVKDLTRRINELQQKAIKSTESYEGQVTQLENSIDELKQALQSKEFEIDDEINAATKKERISNTTLAEKNRYLLGQVKAMKLKLDEELSKNAQKLKEKKDTITQLKDKLSQKDSQTNKILTEHTKKILQIEQDNTTALRKLRENSVATQAKYKKDINAKNRKITFLMRQHKKELDNIRLKLESQESKVQKSSLVRQKDVQVAQEVIKNLQREVDSLKQEKEVLKTKFVEVENQSIEISATKERQCAQMIHKVKMNLSSNIKDTDKEVKALEERVLEAAEIINGLKTQKKSLENELAIYKTKNQKLVSKEQYDENEKKHAQNYKILNEKIAQLKAKNNTIFKEAEEYVAKIETKVNNKKKLLESAKEGKTSKLKAKISSISKNLEEAHKRLLKLDKTNQELRNENAKLLSEYDLLRQQGEVSESSYQAKYNNAMKKLGKSQDQLLKATNEMSDIKAINEKLQKQNQSLRSKDLNKIKTLKTRLASASESLKFSQDKVMRLKDDVNSLEGENKSLIKENNALKKGKVSVEKVYKSKVSRVETQAGEFQKQIEDLNSQILSLKGDIVVLNKKNTKLIETNQKIKEAKKEDSSDKKLQAKLDEAMGNLRNRRAEIMALKNDIESLQNKNTMLENQTETLKTMQKEDESGENANKQVASLKKSLAKIQAKNISLMKELRNSNNKTTQTNLKPSKLAMLDSIKCDDMQTGTNEPSSNCKARVNSFLKKYGAGYFYEVVPIVDNGGFAALKKVQNSKLGVPNSEIERLTRLSNIGLGKDRSASGGKLIKKAFGDFARISYSVSNMDIPKKRGFVIRVYK